MQQTILIQTDFTTDSLVLIKNALHNYPDAVLDIVLVHGIQLSESISSLLFFSKGKLLRMLSNDTFNEQLGELRAAFPHRIGRVRIDFFTGENQAAFDHFLEGNRIDKIFVSGNYAVRKVHRSSKDLTAFIERSLREKVNISWSAPIQGNLITLKR